MTPPPDTGFHLEHGSKTENIISFKRGLYKSYDNGIKMKDTFIRISGWLIMTPPIIFIC